MVRRRQESNLLAPGNSPKAVASFTPPLAAVSPPHEQSQLRGLLAAPATTSDDADTMLYNERVMHVRADESSTEGERARRVRDVCRAVSWQLIAEPERVAHVAQIECVVCHSGICP